MYLPFFTNLKSLKFAQTTKGVISFTAANAKLEEIYIAYSGIEKLEGLEHLPALKKIMADSTENLTELIFSAANAKLEEIKVFNSSIKKLEGLKHLTALKQVDARMTDNLTELHLPQSFQTRGVKVLGKKKNIIWEDDD